MADRIVVMNHGRIEQVGTPREIYASRRRPSSPTSSARSTCCRRCRRAAAASASATLSLAVRAASDASGRRPRSSCTCAPKTSACTSTASAPAGRWPRAQVAQDRVPRRVLPRRRLALDATRRASRWSPTCSRQAVDSAWPRAEGSPLSVGLPRECAAPARHDARRHEHALRTARHRAAAHARDAARALAATGSRRRCCSLACVALALFLLAPLVDDPRQERAGQGRRVRRAAPVPANTSSTPALRAVGRGTRCGWRPTVTAITVPLAFTFAYALTRSCMPGKGVFRLHRADADPRAVAARGDLVHPVVRQPGRAQGALLGGASIYGPIGIIISAVYATSRTR